MAEHEKSCDRAEVEDEGRRRFLKSSLAVAVSGSAISAGAAAGKDLPTAETVVDNFQRGDSLYLGDGWESINPGYFEIQKRTLRRRLHNVGDRRPGTWFPWHWETHRGQPMPLDYDPSLPVGIIWRRDWKLRGAFTLVMEGQVMAVRPEGGEPKWKMNRPGYAFAALAIGGRTLFESWEAGLRPGHGALVLAWHDDGRLAVLDHATPALLPVVKTSHTKARRPVVGERFRLELEVRPTGAQRVDVHGRLKVGDDTAEIVVPDVDADRLAGFVGVAGRGLLDWQASRVALVAGDNHAAEVPVNELHVCYALGDTLRERGGRWRCKFVALFRGDGGRAELRIAAEEKPAGGWKAVPVVATAANASAERLVVKVENMSSPRAGRVCWCSHRGHDEWRRCQPDVRAVSGRAPMRVRPRAFRLRWSP